MEKGRFTLLFNQLSQTVEMQQYKMGFIKDAENRVAHLFVARDKSKRNERIYS